MNSVNRLQKKRAGYLLIWIILLLCVWFIKSDKNIGRIMQTLIQNYLYLGGNVKEETVQDEKHASQYKMTYNDAAYCEYFAQSYIESAYAETIANTSFESTMDSATYDSIEAMTDFSAYLSTDMANYDYLKSNFYVVDSSTNITTDELDADNLLNMDLTIDTTSEDYKILIYHTHGTESFADSREGEVEDTVIGVGNYLTSLLEEEYGVRVYHDTTAYDMVDGVLDRSKAYDYAREGVEKILEAYPSIEVVIDIHRDGVAEGTYLVTEIDGKKMAQIMFLNGVSRLNQNGDISYLENPNKIENLAFSLQLFLTGKANYDSLMRKIYIRGYRYNLDFRGKSLLIEVGSQTNTVEEAKNAMEPFAAILYKVLSGE